MKIKSASSSISTPSNSNSHLVMPSELELGSFLGSFSKEYGGYEVTEMENFVNTFVLNGEEDIIYQKEFSNLLRGNRDGFKFNK